MTKKPQEVYTLVVELGRSPGDGLPKGATGAALMCFASGVDEAEAVRETVAILKQAEMAPLDVTGYGTVAERLEQGHEVGQDERDLMARALAENSVVVAQLTPFYDEAGADAALGRFDDEEADDTPEADEAAPVRAPSATPGKKPSRRGPKPGGAGAKPAGPKTAGKPVGKPGRGATAKPSAKSSPKSGPKTGAKPAGKPGGKPRTR